jgi:hypothetical protein
VAVDETKMTTAPPRNNAFGQGNHLVRSPGYVRLLSEHVAGPIDVEAVRPIDETAAEIRNHFSAGV